jgi:hypothetical protein
VDTHRPPVTYSIASALTSPIFGKAFANGCGGELSSDPRMLLDGDVAMFGHPDLIGLLKQAQAEGRTWYYGDKAYFGREVYYRITKNAYMHNTEGEPDFDRFKKLNLTVQQWKDGNDILICPQSDVFFRLQGKTQNEWIEQTIKQIRKHSDRKIRYQYKSSVKGAELAFKRSLRGAWAVVVHSSMAGVQAAIHGVPCFATDPKSTSAKFGTTDLSLIESPVRPDNREHMAAVLAANQWTISEINSGLAWECIK